MERETLLKWRIDAVAGVLASQQQLVDVLEPLIPHELWRMDADSWSFRGQAVHLLAVDADIFSSRLLRIALGAQPSYEYYLNSGWDLDAVDMRHALDGWITVRAWMCDFVNCLAPEALQRTGTHATFGQQTPLDLLDLMRTHDLEHLEELQPQLAAFHATQKQ